MDTYEQKQCWLEQVMASGLSNATKVYAWGVFQHMYGEKTDAWPGAKAINEVTRLDDSQYYKYNKALAEAGFLQVTSRKGKSNSYHLAYPPPTEVTPTSNKGGYPPSTEVTPTLYRGTKTIKKTTSKTSMEDNKDSTVTAGAVPVSPNGVVKEAPEVVPVTSNDTLVLGLNDESVNQESLNNPPPMRVGSTPVDMQERLRQIRETQAKTQAAYAATHGRKVAAR